MQILILYDNESIRGFKRGWGFSCLINKRLLFDVGANLEILLFNIRKASLNINSIDLVFLSHEHRDHVGGIDILHMLGDVEVFIPKSFSNRFKRRLRSFENVVLKEIDKSEEIFEGFYTTGELGNTTKEHSLITETDKGLVIFTGCSHPGLVNILNVARKRGTIYGVIGGFHDFNKIEILKDISYIVPCHCTARKKEILYRYPDKSLKCSAGNNTTIK
jgi:7,8-dihydropterin-6-yl-methyl-4-(beta-D-ribofuranosyl)aminobenzene 5'-phosphate synthase